eukprot:1828526-Ditylum_brightwellii.AAC.1
MKILREDDNFANTIGNNFLFDYKVDHDMDEFRAEIRKFVLRLAYVTAASEDRTNIQKGIKEQVEEVGNMSCSEIVELQL